MSNKVQIKIAPVSLTLNDLWVIDVLSAKAGDTVHWESSGQEMILFVPIPGLFEGAQILPDQRVFEIAAQPGHGLELKLKPEICPPEETIMIPYAIFRIPTVEISDVEMRAKMIIKRSGG